MASSVDILGQCANCRGPRKGRYGGGDEVSNQSLKTFHHHRGPVVIKISGLGFLKDHNSDRLLKALGDDALGE